MEDECVDVSNREQLTICLRWVDDSLEALVYFALVLQHMKCSVMVQFLMDKIKNCMSEMFNT